MNRIGAIPVVCAILAGTCRLQTPAVSAQDTVHVEQTDDEADDEKQAETETPGANYPDEIVLADGIRITKEGAIGIPPDGYTLTTDLATSPFPKCPAGSRITQKEGRGFFGLRVFLPDGSVLMPMLAEPPEDVESLKLWQLCAFSRVDGAIVSLYDAVESAPNQEEILSLDRFREMLSSAAGRLDGHSVAMLCLMLSLHQDAPVSFEDIVRLTEAKRQAISSISFEVESRWTAKNPEYDRKDRSYLHSRFAMAGARCLHDCRNGISSDRCDNREVRAFDGEYVRLLQDSKDISKAHILPFDGYRWYFKEDNPLWATMMLNTDSDSDGHSTGNDLSKRVGMIFTLEVPVEFDGRDCLVGIDSSAEVVYFFDPEKNYVLTGLEQGRFSYDQEAGKYSESATYNVRTLRDFQDCGNGIWLPGEIDQVWYEAGNEVLHCSTRISSLDVNGEVPQETFTSFIPKGTLVSDTVKSVSYRQGMDHSVENTLYIPDRGLGSRTTLVLINVVAIMVIGAVLLLRRQSQRKSAP